jgi:NADH dehydrogenase
VPERVVIVGGGFGGAYCAQALERVSRAGLVDATLLDRHNYFVFYPLLVEAGTGSLEPRHVVVPIRSFLKTTAFRMGDVTGADFERREVSFLTSVTRERARLSYDHLVLAPGSVTHLPRVPGLREHGCEMKSLADAVAVRDRAVALLEAAAAENDAARRKALLHFVIVGSSFTGVEVAGEYEMFLRRATCRYANLSRHDYQITLVEIADRILPALDADLADYARRHLERRGVHIRLNSSVEEIRKTDVVLRDGEVIPARTVIWTAGIAPSPLLEKLDLPRDDRGYVLCEPDLRVRGFDNVWALGDSAVNPDAEGKPYPATAQHAVRQGAHLANNLARVLCGDPPQALDFRPAGELVALGCRSGVAKIFGVKLAGFPAWWMYRTVYLLKMPGLSRKARVALDWTFDLVFAPDVVQLGVHRQRRPDASLTRPNAGE